jgi:hypothetical protein
MAPNLAPWAGCRRGLEPVFLAADAILEAEPIQVNSWVSLHKSKS